MNHQNFSFFFKWLLLFLFIIWVLIAGATVTHSTARWISFYHNKAMQLCHFIWDIPSEGFTLAQVQQQLSLSGMNYVIPEPAVLSFSTWLKRFPQQILTSQFQTMAASKPLTDVDSSLEDTPAESMEISPGIMPSAHPPFTENISPQKIDIDKFLKNHEPDTEILPEKNNPLPSLSGKKVILYCTHSSESYTPSSGNPHVDGGHGLINQVAGHLADSLTRNGIPSEFVFAVHDWPSYDNSYTESRKTVQKILSENSGQLAALFDVHRDSIQSEKTADTVTFHQKKAARILLVVGTDQRKPHPNWKQNLALAQKIESVGNTMYPGLIRGITQKAGTYHQELFTGALLLEFGTDLNSLEEAEYASELLADILARVFHEKK